MTGKAYVWMMIIIIAAVGVEAYRLMHTPEAIAAKCAQWDLTETFDDCLRHKGCAYRAGRLAERRHMIAFQTNTYNCPREDE